MKPLTSSQSEKKDGRSVLEKLKSTIHPGRTAHQVVVEPERSQVLWDKNTPLEFFTATDRLMVWPNRNVVRIICKPKPVIMMLSGINCQQKTAKI